MTDANSTGALKRIALYVLARGNELSTWQSLVVVVTAIGYHMTPEWRDAVLIIGPSVVGVLGVAFPDQLNPPK